MTGEKAITVQLDTERQDGSARVSSPTLMVRTPTLRKLIVMDTLHGSAGKCRGYL